MNAVYCFKQLIGTAISIKSSNKILYPSITICTEKSDSPLDYPPELNETLIGRGCVEVLAVMEVDDTIKKKALNYLMFLKRK